MTKFNEWTVKKSNVTGDYLVVVTDDELTVISEHGKDMDIACLVSAALGMRDELEKALPVLKEFADMWEGEGTDVLELIESIKAVLKKARGGQDG